MSPNRRIGSRAGSALVALSLCLAATGTVAGQGATIGPAPANAAAGFKEFSIRVQAYLKLQQTVTTSVPALKSTDMPEIISAYQQVLARKIREARPEAKEGDIFTPAACDAFRRASLAALTGPNSASSRARVEPDSPNPNMLLSVNGVYPATEPVTALSPALLAAFPPLPVELAYRVVSRTLILIDVKSNLVVDIARLILPPA